MIAEGKTRNEEKKEVTREEGRK